MTTNERVTVSAAGKGERIKEEMRNMGFPETTPKSLLPTGNGETLMGRIVRQAMKIGHVEIFANYDNIKTIGESSDLPADVSLSVNRNIYGPLGPLYLDLRRNKAQSMMAAGDFWAEFDWKDFKAFHDSQDTPVSILVGKSIPAKQGAKFHVGDNGTVRSWERVEHTTGEDLINIGAYIVDPEKLVMKKIRELGSHKEDPFNDAMIASGLMSAYVADGLAFNVNNAEVYSALLEHTRPSSE